MNILIVDDKKDNLYFLEAMLQGNGHHVIQAENGAQALEILQSQPIDLIISDILMPVMDGFELCRNVKTHETWRHIPFVIYTATYTGPQDEEFAAKIGADRFIVKPCEPEIFMKTILELMASKAININRSTPPVQEEEILKLYSQRLVRNLEQKKLELEKEVKMRIETEKILRESEEKYKAILENIEDGYYEVDLAGNLTFFNTSMCRMLGYSSQEFMGMNNRMFMDPENARKVFYAFNRVYRTGEPSRELDWELIKKDGAKCFINASVSLIKDSDGNPIGFRGIARDITDRKNAELEKARLTEQLYHAQKMESVGRLAGGVAHDFNNLLSIILGYSEIILNDLDKNHPHYDPLKQIHQVALRAKDLTRQLLAFSRKQVLSKQMVDANQVVIGFEKLLRRLIGENIQLNLNMMKKPLWINADCAQIEQVLMNLAINARDAMPSGGVLTIATSCVDWEAGDRDSNQNLPPGKYALIQVSDSGCGMDKNVISHLFEPFFTTKAKDKGTGLGLATSYGIIKQHGGHIEVYSEVHGGTTFNIFLPLCEAEDALPTTPSLLPPHDLHGSETILLVEDNAGVRELTRLILRQYGYAVLSYETGNAALAAIQNHAGTIHLVLTDVMMPGMNISVLLDQIRKKYPDIKTLFMSGYLDDMIAPPEVLDPGANFIQKPFSITALAAKVREILDKK